MKSTLLLFLLIGTNDFAQSQVPSQVFGFETSNPNVIIDTVSNPMNVWQIGEPSKTFFSYTPFGDRAIVTDTLNSYPTNDTSSFILIHEAENGFAGISLSDPYVHGSFLVYSDSALDFGKIEFSPNNGIDWVLISDDTMTYTPSGGGPDLNWPSPWMCTFTDSSEWLWQDFEITFGDMNDAFSINVGDTILFKFTFISDGTQTSKDGLIFDNIEIYDDWAVGMNETNLLNFTLFPNPTAETVKIQLPSILPETRIVVHNLLGETLINKEFLNESEVQLDVSTLSTGKYVISLLIADQKSSQMLVIE